MVQCFQKKIDTKVQWAIQAVWAIMLVLSLAGQKEGYASSDRIDSLDGNAQLNRSVRGFVYDPASVVAREFSMDRQLLISVVDDDQSIRESLPDLLKEFGFASRAFSSAADFLASDAISKSSCLILDVAMPGMSGRELLHELRRRNLNVPVIFITAHKSEAARTQMLRDGAIECLFKPFGDVPLLQALRKAVGGK